MNDVTIVGSGPTGLMLAGELALAGVDVAILERRSTPDLVGSRARGFHSRTIEIFDQRGIVDRFLAEGQTAQGLSFANTSLNVSGFPSRHPYTLGLGQSPMERILLGWVEELGVPIRRGLEVTGFARTTPASTSTSPTAGRSERRTWSGPMVGAVSSARWPASSSSERRRPGAT